MSPKHSRQYECLPLTEDQTSCPHRKGLPALRQLRLQSDRVVHPGSHADRLQRNQESPPSQHRPSLGRGHQPMAPVFTPSHGLRVPLCLFDCLLGLLEGRPPPCRKDCGLLYRVLDRLLLLQFGHVDRRSCYLPTLHCHRRRQRFVGLVLQP